MDGRLTSTRVARDYLLIYLGRLGIVGSCKVAGGQPNCFLKCSAYHCKRLGSKQLEASRF
ncbi:hypothetical protein KSF78_0006471 [Schistosoma japonicum]|nr:hypothetical protein KSF78_0006471 [Schistosoma japonicum]